MIEAGKRNVNLSPVTTAGWKHTEANRQKMIAAHALAPRTGPKNSFFGKKHTEETKAKMAQSKASAPVLPTTPERIVHGELKRVGVDFLTEHPLGPFLVDAFVPTLNLVVFVDGCYWHACPAHHPTAKKPRSDNSRIPYLTKCGYKVAVLWEHEIESDVTKCLQPWLRG
jgi:DNA mismatch endonuclease (patch repair protein)